MKTFDYERKKLLKQRYDSRLRNTKLLLKNYRVLKAHCQNAIYDACCLDYKSVSISKLMQSIFDDDSDKICIESIRRSAQRTYIIINHIDEMLEIYKIYCERSKKPENIRKYNSLYSMYISDEPSTAEEIAKRENVDKRTVYRDVNDAFNKLTSLLFGVDSIGL